MLMVCVVLVAHGFAYGGCPELCSWLCGAVVMSASFACRCVRALLLVMWLSCLSAGTVGGVVMGAIAAGCSTVLQ